eukprot:Em0005g636a
MVVKGYCFLGGFIGDSETTRQVLHNKITGWVKNLLKLSKATESQALSKSMQFEWTYLQRILLVLFSIPARLGHMGVHNPTESAKIAYTTSKAGTRNIVDAIKGKLEFSLPDHNVLMSKEMANMHTTLSIKMKSHFTQYWYGCVVDLRRHVIIAGGKDVPMVNRSKKMDNSLVCFVLTSESVEIPVSCQMRLAATVSGQTWPVSEIGIVAEFMNEYGLEQWSQYKSIAACKVSSAGLQEERNNLLEERIETMLEEAVTLGDKERQGAKELLRDFKDIIALPDDDLGHTRLLYHHIRTEDTQPICQCARRLPFHQHSQVHLASGYWQVELHPKDKEKTAFVTPFGFYQFRVMPFGLCNVLATFQWLMEWVLAGLQWSSCLVGLSRKFHKPWQGPYRVVKIIGPTEYRIVDCIRKKKIVHFNHLKRARIGKVPELAKGEDMVEGARIDTLPVGPVPGNRNGNDLVEDSLEEETVGMQVTDQAPKGPIAQVPGPPEEIPPAPVAQVPGQPAPAAVRQSTRQTRPPVRYGDPISLPDDVVTCGNTLFNVTWCQTSRHVYASVV